MFHTPASPFRTHPVAAAFAAFCITIAPAAMADLATTDTTFGPNGTGYVVTDLGTTGDQGQDLAGASNDELYALGVTCADTPSNCQNGNSQVPRGNIVTRYSKDGIFDTSFGNNGLLTMNTGSVIFGQANALDVDDVNNFIYLGAENCNQSACTLVVARFKFDGSLDTSFGTGGAVTIPTVNNNPQIRRLFEQSDGKLLVLVEDRTQNNNTTTADTTFIVRLNADGKSFDAGFGNAGKTTINFGCGRGDNLYVSFNATLYITGRNAANCTANSSAEVARVLLSNGNLDSSFGGGSGIVINNFGQTGTKLGGFAAQEQSAGGGIAYVFGADNNTAGFNAFIIMLHNDGTQDNTFATQAATYAPVAQFNQNGGAWFETTGKIAFNGNYATTAANSDEALSRIDGLAIFQHQNRTYPVTPAAFSFTAQTGVARSTVVTSNAATVSGISAPAAISISGGTAPGYSIGCNGTFTASPGTISNGQTVCVRQTSSASFSTATTTTLTVGTASAAFSVTTAAQDTVPNAFSFASQTNVAKSTAITSAAATITGINAPSPISVSGGSYSINGGAFTSAAGTVNNNDSVTVKQTSSSVDTTTTTATVTVGGVNGDFSVTTGDTTPDAFAFTAQTNAATSTAATSNTVTITGITLASPISVSGGSYSIGCNGTFTSSAGTISNNQTVCVQQTSSASFSTTTTATLTVGGVSGGFSVTTAAQDTTPNAFAFTAQTGAAVATAVTSNTITVSGINSPAPISISGGAAAGYSIGCNGTFTATAGTIGNGQTVCVRQTSSASFSTATTTTLTIGGVSGSFSVTTGAQDTTPDAFAFTAQTGAPVATAVTSNTITVSGINSPVPISISGGTAAGYSIGCNGTFTASAGTISNGQTVCVRQTSSANFSTTTTTTLTISTVSGDFSVTTAAQDTTPNPFSFTAQTGVAVSTMVTSNAITVSGINSPSAISISGGGGQYSVNNGTFTAAAGTVNNGDTVRVQLTSSAMQSTAAVTTLTIGGVSGSFSVTTVGASSGGGSFGPGMLGALAALLVLRRRSRRQA